MLVGNAVTGLPFVLRNGVQAGIGSCKPQG